MRIYSPSRRQDLLFGSFVTTLLIACIAWFGDAPHLAAAPPPPPRNVIIVEPMVPVDPDVQSDPQENERRKVDAPAEPSPPRQEDVPQIPRDDAIPQQIEPLDPNVVIRNLTTIPGGPPRGSGHDIYNPSSLDQQPEPRSQGRPQYPSDMKREGMTGEVTVDFIVDTNGDVRNATVIHSTSREFEGSAVDAVSKWKFRAGRRNGHAVYTHMQVPIQFSLDNDN